MKYGLPMCQYKITCVCEIVDKVLNLDYFIL